MKVQLHLIPFFLSRYKNKEYLRNWQVKKKTLQEFIKSDGATQSKLAFAKMTSHTWQYVWPKFVFMSTYHWTGIPPVTSVTERRLNSYQPPLDKTSERSCTHFHNCEAHKYKWYLLIFWKSSSTLTAFRALVSMKIAAMDSANSFASFMGTSLQGNKYKSRVTVSWEKKVSGRRRFRHLSIWGGSGRLILCTQIPLLL